jgi:FlaA1/EpsC-like NDP-sugar epimerase
MSIKIRDRIYNKRLTVIIPFFLSILFFSYYFSFALRFEFTIPDKQWQIFWHTIPILLIIRLSLAYYYGLYKGWFGHVGLSDLVDILKYNTLSSLTFTLLLVLLQKIPEVFRSILFLDWTINLMLIGGVRFLGRFIRSALIHFHRTNNTNDKKHVLIVGAGDAGIIIVHEMNNNPRLFYQPIGFIDDNERKIGKKIAGVPVLGNQQDIFEIIKQNRIDEIIIAIPSATGSQLKNIIANCKKTGLKVKTTPSLNNIIDGNFQLSQVRDIDIEDLIGRKPIFPEQSDAKNELKKKTVLITGAGGSIGSELAWQVSQSGARQIILYERGEYELYQIESKLKNITSIGIVVPIIGDVLDKVRLSEVMEKYRPEIVYHAAAYKHVPIMELNPLEAVRNNLLGTINVANKAIKYGVKKFIFVSTDKAVRPSSIMGATKRAAEQMLKTMKSSSTQFITVRFGNVLDSRGSAVPLFKKQISEGGPVTVTHPFMVRYFMSIQEASQLIIQAGSMGEGGELFLLDMGEPVKIVDLAENLIRLAGLEPYKDIEIEFTGLRPGEKLYEELIDSCEEILPTSHKKIMKINNGKLDAGFMALLIIELEEHIKNHDQNGVICVLKKIVPTFTGSYQNYISCLNRDIEENLELNIKHNDKEFRGTVSGIERGETIQIALPSTVGKDMLNIAGKLEATFYHPFYKKVLEFKTSIISSRNGHGPISLTVKYPSYFEVRDDLRNSLYQDLGRVSIPEPKEAICKRPQL